MFRFLSFLVGKQYESCKGCEVLKTQLSIVNQEKAQLTETLLNLLQPKVYAANPQELEPIVPKIMTFGRRRAILEEQDRVQAKIMRESNLVSRSTEELEKELSIND